MSDNTHIEWTDATWNPVTGCSVVSPGCTNCYAMRLAGTRLQHHPSRAGLTVASKAGPVWNGEVRFNEGWLEQPLRWRRPRRIFVCAHGDLFHESVPDAWIDQVWSVMARTQRHTFQVLTKRPERARGYLRAFAEPKGFWTRGGREPAEYGGSETVIFSKEKWPLPNVHLGVSVEDQARADERIPILLDTPAAVRWISAEPLLGPVNPFMSCCDWQASRSAAERSHISLGKRLLDWVVVGGESGPGARPMHPDWARQIRDDCAAAGVPFLFKQWGEWTPGTAGHVDDEPDLYLVGKRQAGRRLDGVLHDAYPEPAQ